MLTHVNEDGDPQMVDVGSKSPTRRTATAESNVHLPREVLAAIRDDEIVTKKGPVVHTAIVAGTMAAKRTSDLIPFCHPIPLDSIRIRIETDDAGMTVTCSVATNHVTGVEMEALVGASVAALTVYDMCKAMSREIVVRDTRLLKKSGGKSDYEAV